MHDEFVTSFAGWIGGDLGIPGKVFATELTVTPEKSVDLPTPRSKAVSNPVSDIHNKVSNPTIVVCAENIADDPDNVTEPGKKSKSKSNIVEVTNSPSFWRPDLQSNPLLGTYFYKQWQIQEEGQKKTLIEPRHL